MRSDQRRVCRLAIHLDLVLKYAMKAGQQRGTSTSVTLSFSGFSSLSLTGPEVAIAAGWSRFSDISAADAT